MGKCSFVTKCTFVVAQVGSPVLMQMINRLRKVASLFLIMADCNLLVHNYFDCLILLRLQIQNLHDIDTWSHRLSIGSLQIPNILE